MGKFHRFFPVAVFIGSGTQRWLRLSYHTSQWHHLIHLRRVFVFYDKALPLHGSARRSTTAKIACRIKRVRVRYHFIRRNCHAGGMDSETMGSTELLELKQDQHSCMRFGHSLGTVGNRTRDAVGAAVALTPMDRFPPKLESL